MNHQSHIVDVAPEALPTEDDVRFYEEHGWWISGKILPDDLLDLATAAAFRFYEERDHTLPVATGYSDWTDADGLDVLRNNEFASLQSDGLALVARQPIIGAIAARLARDHEIRLFDDQLVYKPASTNAAVGWHADKAYWGTCSSDSMLTAWIPFHDVDEERAPLVVLDRSHRWRGIEQVRWFNNPELAATEGRFEADGRSVVRVPICLSKGQVSFHHGWTLHGSYPARGTQYRLALAVHLQNGDNHYRAARRTADGRGIHVANEQFCRRLPNGDPDFGDPSVFPRIWPVG